VSLPLSSKFDESPQSSEEGRRPRPIASIENEIESFAMPLPMRVGAIKKSLRTWWASRVDASYLKPNFMT